MRKKKDILKAGKLDTETSLEMNQLILQRCLLEVLIDIRDILNQFVIELHPEEKAINIQLVKP